MVRRRIFSPKKSLPGQRRPIGILELDRFSEVSLQQWQTLSEDLNELWRVLYFALEPERRRLRPELLEALKTQHNDIFSFSNWVRVVSYTHSLNPLSSAGSLLGYGGRFNPGIDLERGTLSAWPALYLSDDFETAFREKFQLPSDADISGLRPHELALQPQMSHVTILLQGRLLQVFDATSPERFEPLARVLGKIKMPRRALELRKKLRISSSVLSMVASGKQLYDALLLHNWRVLPVQFDLPAPSQVVAELIRAAGFEAIMYSSTKNKGMCLAVFPDRLMEGSYIELADLPPHAGTLVRLDPDSAEYLAGWEVLPQSLRNGFS